MAAGTGAATGGAGVEGIVNGASVDLAYLYVQTQDGETYMAYLCGRPLPNRGRCVLGRETAIQKMVWSHDGWLRTADGQGAPGRKSSGTGKRRWKR